MDQHPDIENVVLVFAGMMLIAFAALLDAKCRLVVKDISMQYAIYKAKMKQQRLYTPPHSDDHNSHSKHHHKLSIRKQFQAFRTETGKLFWFGRPGLIQWAVQVILYLECVYFTNVLYACYMGQKSVVWWIVFVVISLFNVVIIVPDLLSKYVQAVYSSDLLDPLLIRRTVNKMIKRKILTVEEIQNSPSSHHGGGKGGAEGVSNKGDGGNSAEEPDSYKKSMMETSQWVANNAKRHYKTKYLQKEKNLIQQHQLQQQQQLQQLQQLQQPFYQYIDDDNDEDDLYEDDPEDFDSGIEITVDGTDLSDGTVIPLQETKRKNGNVGMDQPLLNEIHQ